jgi:hypothetical protein
MDELERMGSVHNLQRSLEVVSLRRLWRAVERAQEAIARSMVACRESRELLRRIED